MFECSVSDFSTLACGTNPDGKNQQIRWIEIDKLANSDFYPKAIITYLKAIKKIKETIVLGDVNQNMPQTQLASFSIKPLKNKKI